MRKGFSIMDWALLKSRTKDLAGRGGEPARAITRNEVSLVWGIDADIYV